MPGQVAIEDLRRREAADDLDFGDRVFLALLALVGTTADDIAQIGRYEELRAALEGVSTGSARRSSPTGARTST